MEIYSIGFTQKSAGEFFEALKAHGIERLLDVRLNNTSQLAGFAKQADLAYFLKEICGAEYEHEPLLAPTQEMLDTYQKEEGRLGRLYGGVPESDPVAEGGVGAVKKESFEKETVLLCSEATAEHCHRRLALEYLQNHWGDIIIRHL